MMLLGRLKDLTPTHGVILWANCGLTNSETVANLLNSPTQPKIGYASIYIIYFWIHDFFFQFKIMLLGKKCYLFLVSWWLQKNFGICLILVQVGFEFKKRNSQSREHKEPQSHMLNRARLEKTRNCTYDSTEQACIISLQLEGQESGPWKPKTTVGMASDCRGAGRITEAIKSLWPWQ